MGEYDLLQNLSLEEYRYMYAGITGKEWFKIAPQTSEEVRSDAISRLAMSGPNPLPVIEQNLRRLERDQSQTLPLRSINHPSSRQV